MIGYKVAKAGDTRVIVTLEIPDDALTNRNRKNIVNVDTAKYRTNKAIVLKIEDESGKEYDEATSFCYLHAKMTYTVNKEFVVENYDTNIDIVCSPGIHFFLSRRVAELYHIYEIENGVYQAWHDNGRKETECTFVNRKIEGLYQEWHDNGQKFRECMFVNDKREGVYRAWHENGVKQTQYTSVNGNVEGLYQEWHDNDHKRRECMYVNGKIEGLYQSWHANGEKKIECMYVNGEETLRQIWDENGENF